MTRLVANRCLLGTAPKKANVVSFEVDRKTCALFGLAVPIGSRHHVRLGHHLWKKAAAKFSYPVPKYILALILACLPSNGVYRCH